MRTGTPSPHRREEMAEKVGEFSWIDQVNNSHRGSAMADMPRVQRAHTATSAPTAVSSGMHATVAFDDWNHN